MLKLESKRIKDEQNGNENENKNPNISGFILISNFNNFTPKIDEKEEK